MGALSPQVEIPGWRCRIRTKANKQTPPEVITERFWEGQEVSVLEPGVVFVDVRLASCSDYDLQKYLPEGLTDAFSGC